MSKRITILLAEDDPDDRLFAEEALNDCGIPLDLHMVEDGQETLDYLYRRGRYADPTLSPQPDLILLDLNMPRKDGREVAQEIKADEVLRSIPLVILTTSKNEEDIAGSYELGVNSFIVKPLTYDRLVEVMQSITNYWFETAERPQTVRYPGP